MPPNVLIIGGGIAGLAAVKQCLAEGFRVTCIEAREHCGGQWLYEEVSLGVETLPSSSMYESVTIQSSRDMMGFSDFPMDPERYPTFSSHREVLAYLYEYADFFNLWPHIRMSTIVTRCRQINGGQWQVWCKRVGQSDETVDIYDAVLACTGRQSKPLVPEFSGLDIFGGSFLHSHWYRTPDSFAGKTVVLIGLGNTGGDLAVELSGIATVHIVARRGAWVVPRLISGKPTEYYNTRASQLLVLPPISRWLLRQLLTKTLGTLPSELQPDVNIGQLNPVINDDLVHLVRKGMITLHRAEIEQFTESSIELSDGNRIEAEVVIACTGYQVDFPYLPPHTWQASPKHELYGSTNRTDLYRLMMSPSCDNLFFLGIFHAFGPFPPIAEMQARWVTALMAQRVPKPSKAIMWEEIEDRHRWNSRQFVNSDRHVNNVMMLSYCDKLAQDLGNQPKLVQLLRRALYAPFQILGLLFMIYFSILTASQYRLFGHGSCPELAMATMRRISAYGQKLSVDERSQLAKLRATFQNQVSRLHGGDQIALVAKQRAERQC